MRGSGLKAGFVGALALVCGCASPPHNNVLVFATETKFGLDLSREGVEAPGAPSVTLGYKRREAVWLPLVANKVECKPRPHAGLTLSAGVSGTHPDCVVMPTNDRFMAKMDDEETDAYSVFASFGAHFQGGESEANGKLAQFFSTGVAAQRLAENESVGDALSVQPTREREPKKRVTDQDPDTWRDIVVAEERRCSTYRSDDYRRRGIDQEQVMQQTQEGCDFGPFEEVADGLYRHAVLERPPKPVGAKAGAGRFSIILVIIRHRRPSVDDGSQQADRVVTTTLGTGPKIVCQ